jgi:hypothetical protein
VLPYLADRMAILRDREALLIDAALSLHSDALKL